ncbi:MAG: branched-chain amino acid aminotransferase [Alphaproteobacteria bacterium]|nr:branched-chain amino acid aminotransferase [Alphaproteobacteria bacterium]
MAEIVPFDRREGFLWFDGKLVPWADAKIHVLTHGLHYASCVFEGVRLYSGRVYKLQEHTKRLFTSAEILGMKIPYTEQDIEAATIAVCRAQGYEDAYIRPVVWRGSEQMSVAAPKSRIHVAIGVWQWPTMFDAAAKLKGVRLEISKWRRPAPDTAPTQAKAAGLYMICTMSKHDAESRGYADAMMLDYRGYVAEATGANIFFAENGKLHTPIADCFLNGITRQSVIALARARQIPVIVRHIRPEELAGFEECFVTGSAAEVTPVSEIGPYTFKPGRLCEAMMHAYQADVRAPVSEVVLDKAS